MVSKKHSLEGVFQMTQMRYVLEMKKELEKIKFFEYFDKDVTFNRGNLRIMLKLDECNLKFTIFYELQEQRFIFIHIEKDIIANTLTEIFDKLVKYYAEMPLFPTSHETIYTRAWLEFYSRSGNSSGDEESNLWERVSLQTPDMLLTKTLCEFITRKGDTSRLLRYIFFVITQRVAIRKMTHATEILQDQAVNIFFDKVEKME